METVKQDWLEGAYRSSDHTKTMILTAAAQANAETLASMALAIEEIQAQEEQTEEKSEE